MALVSRSGYYAWEKREKNKDDNPKEQQDRKDFELILEVYKRKNIKKGAKKLSNFTKSVVDDIKKHDNITLEFICEIIIKIIIFFL